MSSSLSIVGGEVEDQEETRTRGSPSELPAFRFPLGIDPVIPSGDFKEPAKRDDRAILEKGMIADEFAHQIGSSVSCRECDAALSAHPHKGLNE